MNPPEPLMTAQQVAEWLQVDPAAVYEWARSGRLPCVRLGKAVRFKRASIEQVLVERPPAVALAPEPRRPGPRATQADAPWRGSIFGDLREGVRTTTTRDNRVRTPHNKKPA